MEERHIELLRKHRVILKRDLEPKKLLPYLVTDLVLDETDEEEIKTKLTREDQADKLLEILPRRGPQAFICFIEALENVQLHLAAKLREEEEGTLQRTSFNSIILLPFIFKNKRWKWVGGIQCWVILNVFSTKKVVHSYFIIISRAKKGGLNSCWVLLCVPLMSCFSN